MCWTKEKELSFPLIFFPFLSFLSFLLVLSSFFFCSGILERTQHLSRDFFPKPTTQAGLEKGLSDKWFAHTATTGSGDPSRECWSLTIPERTVSGSSCYFTSDKWGGGQRRLAEKEPQQKLQWAQKYSPSFILPIQWGKCKATMKPNKGEGSIHMPSRLVHPHS